MKYRLKLELPFMKAGTIFKSASSLGYGDGWAIPARPKEPEQIADNPVRTFADYQNSLLNDIIDNEKWIDSIPETNSDKLYLFESGEWTREEYLQGLA